jgi:RimJ/RimL family protein N-acetyltransferase
MKILETRRLILRTWEETDADSMTEINQDPRVCEFLAGMRNRELTSADIKLWQEHQAEKGFSLYAVELKESGQMIGFLGLYTPRFVAHFTPTVEIGWRLSSQYWNKGYATEGANVVLDFAFSQIGLSEVVSFTVVNNKASRRVMEKVGLHHNPKDDFDHPMLAKDSPLKAHVLYRLSREEFTAISSQALGRNLPS